MADPVVELLNCANLSAPEPVRLDLASGRVDPRLLALLSSLLQRHALELSVIKTGHPMGPMSPAGRENDHLFFRAADIVAVDGLAIATSPVAEGVVDVGRYLMSVRGDARASRVMGPQEWLAALGAGDRSGFRDDFATRIHSDHLHIGF